MSDGRVDTHHHVLPPAFRNWLIEKRLYKSPPVAWSVARALQTLDERGIRTAIVSTAPIGLRLNSRDRSAKAREVNEYTAEMAKDYPDRFGFFATLPLPDVDAALEEVRVAFDEFGADGALLPTNVEGRYLGAADFEPVFEELDRRGAVLFTHPTGGGLPPAPGIPLYVAGHLLDTVRTAIDLVRTGRVAKYPNVKIILSHGGGFVPYAAHRISLSLATWEALTAEEVTEQLRSFYFDTALAAGPYSLPSLLAFAKPGHVLYGSDWPFSEDEMSYLDRLFDEYPMTTEQRAAVEHGNAQALFPRLAGTAGQSAQS
jgi:predicted TIM-barrel fold metal-dependent hydrolase